jgi:hypothetical protein
MRISQQNCAVNRSLSLPIQGPEFCIPWEFEMWCVRPLSTDMAVRQAGKDLPEYIVPDLLHAGPSPERRERSLPRFGTLAKIDTAPI